MPDRSIEGLTISADIADRLDFYGEVENHTSDHQRWVRVGVRLLAEDDKVLAEIIEHDSNLMHAVMMTSEPVLFYWDPATLQVMKAVQGWRRSGLPAFFTIDAGPNVHVICEAHAAAQVNARLLAIPGVTRVLQAHAGGPARLITSP